MKSQVSGRAGPGWQPTQVRKKVAQDIPSSTRPSYVDTDVGYGYLKMPTNSQGPGSLINELVGTELARWFELPTFQFALLNASPADLDPESNDEELLQGFITKEEQGEPWKGTAKELNAIVNKQDLSRLVVFDTWIRNTDRYSERLVSEEWRAHRNESNVFLSHEAERGKFRMKVYDHTHCGFASVLTSTAEEFENRIHDDRVYGNFPEFSGMLRREIVQNAAEKLRVLNDTTITQIVSNIPNEWFSDPQQSQGRNQIIEFVKRRAEFVSETIEAKLFPQLELDL